ncbi:hypothetical protein [Pseudomonas monteilii]|uniref:hypothetical protein n=1 Tax=Pseudomonas monteilii TaxID=76759 RepID=UPI001112CF39|nr:hypothetical protein [Pseudomonas monteilii]
MATYFVVNRPSNLITGVVSTSYTPSDSNTKLFVRASERSLDQFYKHLARNPEVLMDIGELMAKSPYINDQISQDRTPKATPKVQRRRDEQPCKSECREQLIQEWITANPMATAYDLHEVFCTGTVAAAAYLSKYA